jgi:solute carrier family 50 protein (sugar transporter)
MALSIEQWTFVFGLLGNAISFGVFMSPLPTFYQIFKKKSTQEYQSLPYVVALLSSMLWVYYAFLKPNSTLLMTINSFGCFIETIYIAFFLYYATKKTRIETGKMLLFVVCGFGVVASLTYFLAKGLTRVHIVGWICLVFALCVFVAPLGILRKVIRTKSVEYMPFSLSAFLTLSAVVWFSYGLLMKDINVALPNVLGFILGVLQMVLYKIYYKPQQKGSSKKLPETLADHIVIVGPEDKREEIIDIDNLGNNDNNSERIPVVLCRIDEPVIESPKEHCVQMVQPPQMVQPLPISVTA